ncbi:hypothetical protein EVAR_99454_1 [Eumeta japonica]|uniref:Uncharacterized protein n=1 Tax=Eumeta variegata TaxID=151549 RepID=A0A4C2ADX2_EUMVA|nr:hypothetical protein EVAR_99454_1 [Eumeta japonica]
MNHSNEFSECTSTTTIMIYSTYKFSNKKKIKQLAAFFCPDSPRLLCEGEGEVSACASCRSPVGHSSAFDVRCRPPALPALAPPTPTTFRCLAL